MPLADKRKLMDSNHGWPFLSTLVTIEIPYKHKKGCQRWRPFSETGNFLIKTRKILTITEVLHRMKIVSIA